MDALKKYAWVMGLLGGALVLTFLVSYASLQEVRTSFGVVGGLGSAMLLAYLWLDREQVGGAAKSRSTSLGGGAVLLVALGLGLAIAANVLGKRYDQRWDMTSAGSFTLSEQSIKVAQGLDQPVEVMAFFGLEAMESGSAFRQRYEGYAQHTSMLSLQEIDPVSEPMLAQQSGVTSVYGTVVLRMGERSQRLESDFSEEALTNALINLSSGEEHILCFTEGHGERDLDDDFEEGGYGGIILKAEGGNYTAQRFSPFKEGVPEQCEVVLIAGAQTDFLPVELQILNTWLDQGGAMMVLMEPYAFTADNGVTSATPQLAANLAQYGIVVGTDLVIEADPQFLQAGLDATMVMLLPDSFDFHPVVSEIDSFVLLELARSVEVSESLPEGIQALVLARTSSESWAESDPTAALQGELEPDEDDKIGDVGVMALAEIGETGGRVVVFGDSDFASNKLLINGNNLDLFMNSVAWLVGEEDQIAIRASESQAGQLNATLAQLVLSGLLVMLVFPGLAVAAATATWVVRRKL